VDVVELPEAVRVDTDSALGGCQRIGHEYRLPVAGRGVVFHLERVQFEDARLPGGEVAKPGRRLHEVDVGGNMVRHAVREGSKSGTALSLEVLIPAKLCVEQLIGGPDRGGERYPVVIYSRLYAVTPEPLGDGGDGIVGRSSVGSQLVTRHVHAVIRMAGRRHVKHGLVQRLDTFGLLLEGDAEQNSLVRRSCPVMLPALRNRSQAIHDPSRRPGPEQKCG
jgi:hypothetical protein